MVSLKFYTRTRRKGNAQHRVDTHWRMINFLQALLTLFLTSFRSNHDPGRAFSSSCMCCRVFTRFLELVLWAYHEPIFHYLSDSTVLSIYFFGVANGIVTDVLELSSWRRYRQLSFLETNPVEDLGAVFVQLWRGVCAVFTWSLCGLCAALCYFGGSLVRYFR